MISALSSTTAPATPTATASTAADMNAAQDRFLKLLVAQLNNQDPMNPVDNAQMTSQMAQINTVTGIQQVNATLKSMSEQFTAMQVLQGASMVGKEVLIDSSTLTRSNGVAHGAIDLSGAATAVKVTILSPAGQVIDSLDLGALPAGRHTFDWNASAYLGQGEPSFQVAATQGKQAITATPLARDKVQAVGSDNGAMSIQFQGRSAVPYSSIKAIL